MFACRPILSTTPTSLLDRHRAQLLLLTTAWTTSGVIIYLLAPLATPGLVLLSPVAPLGWCVAIRHRLPRHRPLTLTLALVFAGAYLSLNASWSLSPATAHIALAVFFMFVMALYFTSNALQELDADILRAMAIGLCAGMVIGGAV